MNTMSRHARYTVEAHPQQLINRPMHEWYLRSLHTHNYLNSMISDMQGMYNALDVCQSKILR